MTKFIYQNQEKEFKVQKGELFQVLTPKIKQQFNIPSNKQIIFCHLPMHNEYLAGVMLQSPIKAPLEIVYCYVVSSQQYKSNFRKIILLDDLGDDNSELEFLIYQQMNVSDLFQIYKFTKSLMMKHCRFKVISTGQEVPHETKISYLPDRIKLKAVFDLYKIIFMKDGEGIDKAKIPRSYFRNTAKQLLKKIEPKLAQENQQANICFNYYGVDIPEKELIIPEDGEDIIISIKSIKSKVNVTVIDQLSRRPIITKVVQKQSIIYRSAKEIFNLLIRNFEYDSFMFENFLEHQKYYKNGDNIVIIAGKGERDQINIQIPAAFPQRNKDNRLETLKRELRNVFELTMEEKDENKLILDLITVYSRALMDQ